MFSILALNQLFIVGRSLRNRRRIGLTREQQPPAHHRIRILYLLIRIFCFRLAPDPESRRPKECQTDLLFADLISGSLYFRILPDRIRIFPTGNSDHESRPSKIITSCLLFLIITKIVSDLDPKSHRPKEYQTS